MVIDAVDYQVRHPLPLLADCSSYQAYRRRREWIRALLREPPILAALAVLPRSETAGLDVRRWIAATAECARCTYRVAARAVSRASRLGDLGVWPGPAFQDHDGRFWWWPDEFVAVTVEQLYSTTIDSHGGGRRGLPSTSSTPSLQAGTPYAASVATTTQRRTRRCRSRSSGSGKGTSSEPSTRTTLTARSKGQ